MKVLVHGGSGRMGAIICQMSKDGFAGAQFCAAVDPYFAAEDAANGIFKSLDAAPAADVDVVIDFSHHSATETLLTYCKNHKLPVVVCTTGQTEEERQMIRDAANEIPVFFSANMSVGVAVLADLAKRAAAMFPEANIELVEIHHNQKLDVPSGTALLLANAIKESRTDAEFLVGRHENGKRTDKEIGIHSLRLGNEVGTHEILISTGNETLTLKHKAESRALFAEGALKAAAYLYNKSAGMYNMQSMIGD